MDCYFFLFVKQLFVKYTHTPSNNYTLALTLSDLFSAVSSKPKLALHKYSLFHTRFYTVYWLVGYTRKKSIHPLSFKSNQNNNNYKQNNRTTKKCFIFGSIWGKRQQQQHNNKRVHDTIARNQKT